MRAASDRADTVYMIVQYTVRMMRISSSCKKYFVFVDVFSSRSIGDLQPFESHTTHSSSDSGGSSTEGRCDAKAQSTTGIYTCIYMYMYNTYEIYTTCMHACMYSIHVHVYISTCIRTYRVQCYEILQSDWSERGL